MVGTLASSPAPPASPPGRRRAVSRHRRSLSARLPTGWTAVTRIALPGLVLALLASVIAVAWSAAPTHPGPLPPPVTLVAALLTIVLTYAVARRVRLAPLAAGVAAALVAIPPPIARAAGVGVPEHLAGVALLVAVLLLSVRSRRRVLVPIAALLAGAAAAVAPLAVAAAPFLAWQVARTLRRRHRVPTLPLSGAIYFATVAAGWGVLGLDPAAPPSAGAAAALEWLRTYPIGTGVGLGAIVWGLLTPRLRPLSGYALTVLALSLWPDGDQTLRYTVLLSPALALLTAAAIERAGVAVRRTDPRIRAAGIVTSAAVALALLSGFVATLTDTTQGRPADAAPAPGETASPAVTAEPGTADRAGLGAQLGGNPRLSLGVPARPLLLEGAVDRRIPIVLAQLLSQHNLTVADFPVVGDENPAVRRSVLVREMDGEALHPGGGSMTALASFLAALTGTYAVESVTVTDAGVLAIFPLPASGGG